MPKRKSITKKKRFEVFKRDGFACVYCGKTPPEIVLELDHIEPHSKGGDDSFNNLITACFDCNRGKRDIPLDKIPPKLSENIEILKEKEKQIKEYRRFISQIKKRKTRDINKIEGVFRETFENVYIKDSFKRGSISKFIELLPLDQVEEAMYLATSKISDPEDCLRYFCGICWRKIKGDQKY